VTNPLATDLVDQVLARMGRIRHLFLTRWASSIGQPADSATPGDPDRRGHWEGRVCCIESRRDPLQVVPVLRHVVVQILHRLDVCFHALDLAIGDEDDAVTPLR